MAILDGILRGYDISDILKAISQELHRQADSLKSNQYSIYSKSAAEDVDKAVATLMELKSYVNPFFERSENV